MAVVELHLTLTSPVDKRRTEHKGLNWYFKFVSLQILESEREPADGFPFDR